MKQISSAQTVIEALRTARVPKDARGVSYVMYAPGDATLYRIGLVTLWPADPESELPAQTVLLVSVNGDMIAISKPIMSYSPWVVDRFAATFGTGRLGWWAAVRPLLAALRWTPEDDRSTEFSPTDWALVSHLV